MTLFIDTTGEGPDVVLLHGWGLHSGVWDSICPTLARDYRVNCVDLPGHGRSDLGIDLADLDSTCAALYDILPHPAHLVGWSLGGLIAQAYALRYPLAVTQLVLVASTPRFVKTEDWPAAMASQTIEGFASSLERNYHLTLKRFLALQVQSSEAAQGTLRRLNAVLRSHPPHPNALRAGLTLLCETDLRDQLPKLQCSTRLILGERDKLVPVGCGQAIIARLKTGHVVIISGAGHAPFLSHNHNFLSLIQDCLKDY